MNATSLFKTTLFTTIAMVAFAANAIICRWTLDSNAIDPLSFSNLRLASGAIMLFIVMTIKNNRAAKDTQSQHNAGNKGSWKAASYLFIYSVFFAYGYIAINTATGALILAGVVQMTMIGHALIKGERLHRTEWIGLTMALIGLVYLMYPELSSPSWWGLLMLMISAYAWAMYSLKGHHSTSPLLDTAYNFYRTLPMIIIVSIITLVFSHQSYITPFGLAMAILSGAVTTGLAYIIWYKALSQLSSSLASASQLMVPLLAAFGALWLISEPITLRFSLAAIVMLGGLSLVLIGRKQHHKSRSRMQNSGQ